jgi:hypothetical protein
VAVVGIGRLSQSLAAFYPPMTGFLKIREIRARLRSSCGHEPGRALAARFGSGVNRDQTSDAV